MAQPSYSYGQNFSENEIKATFLYKITQFIRWENPNHEKLCFIGDKEDQSGKAISKSILPIAKENGR